MEKLIMNLICLRRNNYETSKRRKDLISSLNESYISEGDKNKLTSELNIINEKLYIGSAEETMLAVEVGNTLNAAYNNRREPASNNSLSTQARSILTDVLAVSKDSQSADPIAPAILEVGTQVAALIDEHSSPKIWIMAVITAVNNTSNRLKYTILDADNNPNSQRKSYFLDPAKVIPLSSNYKFESKQRVLALFPNTTVLYPATIYQLRGNSTRMSVEFDDDDNLKRSVEKFVSVPLPLQFYQ